MEIVDIVNEDDEVLYQTAKEKAHQDGLLHRCIVAEIIDSQGNWLLVQQANDRQDAGQFVSPVGGHIRAGEAPELALTRETLEETGITITQCKFVGKAILNREIIGRKENHLFFLYEIYSDQKLSLNHESVGYELFSPQKMQKELAENPTKFGEAFHFIYTTFYSK